MAILSTTAVRDNSTLANFKQWAQAISNFMATAGWAQSADTGQVNWSTIASPPAANTFVYEIWEPNDGLTNFFLKIEYGTNTGSSSTSPTLRISIGTSTNGAGTLTGFTSVLVALPQSALSVTSTTTQWQCYMCGAAGRIGILMWRDETTASAPSFFGVERSINGSGSYTSDYVTIVGVGLGTVQQSISFTGGVGIAFGSMTVAGGSSSGGLCIGMDATKTSGLSFAAFPLILLNPQVGKPGNPMTIVGACYKSDVTEGAQYTVAAADMPYGVAHTYLAAKNETLDALVSFASGSRNQALMMRYD